MESAKNREGLLCTFSNCEHTAYLCCLQNLHILHPVCMQLSALKSDMYEVNEIDDRLCTLNIRQH